MDSAIGIIGGGQLAALLVEEAVKQGSRCVVLDPDPDCPACQKGAEHVPGRMTDKASIHALAAQAELLTIEVEDVALDALDELVRKGADLIPSPSSLRLLINKLTQKQVLLARGLPTSRFQPCPVPSTDAVLEFGLPCVQKAARGGYDGRGVSVFLEEGDLGRLLPVPGFLEAYVAHEIELSVIVARDRHGRLQSYQPTEMLFHEGGNLLDYLIAPARIDETVAKKACHLAETTVAAIRGVGVFGVEMFYCGQQAEQPLLINEVAPRTHNSGHYTLDACLTSQFSQQYRILGDKPLGDVSQQKPAVVFNLLGEAGYQGQTLVRIDDRLHKTGDPSVHIYLYGKKTCFPLRKMGHVTIVKDSIDQALETADRIRPWIRIRGREPMSLNGTSIPGS